MYISDLTLDDVYTEETRCVTEEERPPQTDSLVAVVQPVTCFSSQKLAHPRQKQNEGELLQFLHALLPLLLGESVVLI